MLDRPLFQEEHHIFRDAFRKFLEAEAIPHYEAWEEAGIVDRELWRKAGANGFLCPWVPEEYGGSGTDFLYSVVMIEEVARARVMGFSLDLHNDICGPYIEKLAHEEQKRRWYPGMVSGESLLANAMTEPGIGSDLAAKASDHRLVWIDVDTSTLR